MKLSPKLTFEMLALCCILLAILPNTYAENIQDTFKRDLSVWSNFSSCQEWNDDSDCNFLNSTWKDYDKVSIATQTFVKAHEHEYWNGLSADKDFIDISEKDFSIDLYAHPNTTSTHHPLWEWRVRLSESFETKIEITRDAAFYEEFYAYSDAGGLWSPIYSKELANCDNVKFSMTLNNAGYIKFVALKLNDASNYNVKVSQPYFNMLLVIIVVSAVSALIISIAWVCFILTIVWTIKRMRHARVHSNGFIPPDSKRKEYIKKWLHNMAWEKYSKLNVKYDQTSWIICLNDYEQDEEVHITNECSHVFHYKWLDQWFHNISSRSDLKWPLWSTVITDNSQKPDIKLVNLSEPDEINEEAKQDPNNSNSSLNRQYQPIFIQNQ